MLDDDDFVDAIKEIINGQKMCAEYAVKTAGNNQAAVALENLGKEDIHLVCYNFMPVFDWTRTELEKHDEVKKKAVAERVRQLF